MLKFNFKKTGTSQHLRLPIFIIAAEIHAASQHNCLREKYVNIMIYN